MRAQTGALDSSVVSHDSACEEQLPFTEGVASTAAPFQGMSNIERELSARALRRRGAISSEGPECSIHGHAIARVAPDGPLLTASQPPSNRIEENSGVDLVDESYSINEPLSFAPSFIQSQNQFQQPTCLESRDKIRTVRDTVALPGTAD